MHVAIMIHMVKGDTVAEMPVVVDISGVLHLVAWPGDKIIIGIDKGVLGYLKSCIVKISVYLGIKKNQYLLV